MADEDVAVEVAVGRILFMPLAQAVACGAERAGMKTWPSGVKETLYRLPQAVKRQRKDDGRRGIGGARSFLTQRERRSLSQQLGIPIEDAQQARRVMKERNLTLDEPGTRSFDRFDAAVNEANGGGHDSLKDVASLDLWGDLGKLKPFGPAEWADRIAYHEARIRRGEPAAE